MSNYSEIPFPGTVFTSVLVNLRHGAPTLSAPVARKLPVGSTLTVIALVVGDAYEGNAHWYRVSENNYIWTGACSEINSNPLPTTNVTTSPYTDLHRIPLVVDLYHGDGVRSFQQAKTAGLVGVIHKATTGQTGKDDSYASRREAAKEAGVLWGAYHWGTAADVDGQVKNFLDWAKPDDDTLVAIDFEPTPDNQMTIDNLRIFCEKIYNEIKRRPVIYGGSLLREKLGNARDPFFYSHRLWLAQYGNKPVVPVCWDEYWLWQYTDGIDGPDSCRTVPGIIGNTKGQLDCNHFSGSGELLKQQWA